MLRSSSSPLSLKAALGRIILLVLLGAGLMQMIDRYLPPASHIEEARVDSLALPISENIVTPISVP